MKLSNEARWLFLAHLSRRLRGELIVYQSSCRPCLRECINIFKHEFLGDQQADRNQILSEASLGWGKGFSSSVLIQIRSELWFPWQQIAPIEL